MRNLLCLLLGMVCLPVFAGAAAPKIYFNYNANFDRILAALKKEPLPDESRRNCAESWAKSLTDAWESESPPWFAALTRVTTLRYPRAEMDANVVTYGLPKPGHGPEAGEITMISSPMLLVMPREARSAADLKTCQAKLMPYREKSVVRVFYGNLHLFRSLYTQGRLDEFTEQKYKAEVSTKYRERGSAFWKQILFQLPTFALAKAVFIEAGRPDLWQFWEKTSRDGAAMGIALELLDRDGHEPFLQTLNPNYRAK